MKKKITKLTPEARERLRAVERVLAGETRRDVGKALGVNESTIGDWVQRYEAEGLKGLSIPRKPRPNTTLDAAALRAALATADEKYHDRLRRLIALAEGKSLRELAAEEKVSEQGIMKARRAWLAGTLPPKND